ncbi:hypothetical protein QBZ16_004755 [Prototheca wickerhamii]|uniref:Threonine dehydratase n=1 Tax=Prototheca wickerhamii TaxID=3111 RepID=A0AAD9IEY4_PROWI|nr:hypothetical protein QBZ16_004755 [Prototheca wickerhamii]
MERSGYVGVARAATVSKEEEEASSASPPPVRPSASDVVVVAPEDYTLAPGQISTVNRISPTSPEDVWEAAPGQKVDWRNQPGGYLREILTARVYDVAVESPLTEARALSEALGGRLLLKREDLQPVKSFKLRGAFNRMAQLDAATLARGVIASSAGNHAQGVAMAARVFWAATPPAIKVAAVRALGATVELVGETYNDTQTHALARAAGEGRAFIHPFDDPHTIAGQGTIAAEVLRQTDMDTLDAVFVAIGGGGLAAGVAAYVKALKPGIKVFGVEPAGANAMAQSLARGRRVTLSKVDGFADGVAVKTVGQETFRLCRALLDGVLLVDNAAISTAIKDVFNETRSILEPSGAVAVAGAKAYLQRPDGRGATVVAITSGANMNFDQLRLVSELADIGGGRESMLVTSIPEERGAFLRFVETALGGSPISITEFKYRTSGGPVAHILFSTTAIVRRLERANCPTRDISGLEVAQVHLRHLVGGRAQSARGHTLEHERIFQVDFPELPGALYRFLKALHSAWNITLFHYRRTGRQSSGVLLGLEISPEQAPALQRCIEQLAEHYTFTELSREGKEVFDMFIGQ